MTNRAYGYRSDNELFEKAADKGAHWRNIRPLVCGFLETKNVYDNATAETRSILVRECSLIYECNVCRNLFRCLANFIKHKRLHCCTRFDHLRGINGNSFQDDIKLKRKRERQENADDSSDNLSYLILKMLADERKRKRETADGASDKETKDSPLKNSNCRPRILKNIDEAKDGKSLEVDNENEVEVKTLVTPTKMENYCDSCERNFESRKSLQMHILKKHKLQKYGFQCPSCSLTFPKPAEVMQHLSSEHKKSIRCINIMRHEIHKQRVLNDKKHLKTETVQHDQKDTVSADDKESIENAFSCVNCKKSFQRKTMLQTHQSNCILSNTSSDQSKNSDLRPEVLESLANPCDVPLIDANKVTTGQSYTSILKSENLKSDFTQDKEQECSNSQKKNKFPKVMPKHIPCLCKICNKQFNALGNLRRHISMIHYRTRKFSCKLCDYRAFRKYDVINHLGHIHKIVGDKEKVSQEYIDEHAELSVKEGFDDDIILVTDDKKVRSMEDLHTTSFNADTSGENILQTPEKMKTSEESSHEMKTKYLKPYLVSPSVQKTAPRKRQKLKRSFSQQFEVPVDHRDKRPKRNRIAPVEKDFVYDLSTILKNEVNEKEKESVRYTRRRDTVFPAKAPTSETEEMVLSKPLIHNKADEIKGSAQKTAMICVNQGRAALSSLPQLPSKRPQVRMRQATIHRTNFISGAAVIEAPNIKKEPLQTQLLDDSYLENLSKTTLVNFKMKPQLVLPQSTINSLLKKVDQTFQSQMKIKTEAREVINSLPNLNVPQEMSIDETYVHPQRCDVEPGYSKYFSVNENQRFEIMQCLVGNKANTSESLLRLALEN